MSAIRQKLLLTGTWIYGGVKNEKVCIIRTNFKPGSGDIEDEEYIREDQYGVYYGIHFGKYDETETFLGGAYYTLEEAKVYAFNVCPSLGMEIK